MVQDDSYALVVVVKGRAPSDSMLRSAVGAFQRIGLYETLAVTDGVAPEVLPPFGWPYLPGIAKVAIDRAIAAAPLVMFKAATIEHRIFMTSREFLVAMGAVELVADSAPVA